MEHEFWLARWQQQELGWQQDTVNPGLIQFFPLLLPCQQVLVPLCGASLDLWWLSQRTQVVGAELSALACQQLFDSAGVVPDKISTLLHTRYQYQQLTLWQGDFFTLSDSAAGQPERIYDRAALIALPPAMRAAYVAKLRQLCPHARLLLLTLEYPQAEKQGPPFSVEPSEIAALFPDCRREELLRRDIRMEGFGRRKMQASRLEEVVWLIDWS